MEVTIMYKKILVTLDESKRAEAILPHVESLALAFGAEVILLQVIDYDPTVTMISPYDMISDTDPELLERRAAEAGRYLTDWQQTFQARGIVATCCIEYGQVVGTIMDVAQREGADLVAMASHGRTGLSRLFYGSVAAGVMQRIDRPLLLVRAVG
jgi:nucleotide-binding universal stress UspA family protein